MEAERLLVFTPSRNVGGRRMVCYDDRYILKLASENDGIVVSNDNYRDLVIENPEFKKVVDERLLMYTFVSDRFMPPDDPLGRHGPSLSNFLRKKPVCHGVGQMAAACPYGKKCTYGNKCKFYHPERGNQPCKSVTEKLYENAKIQLSQRKIPSKQKAKATFSLPLNTHQQANESMSLCRTKSIDWPQHDQSSQMTSSNLHRKLQRQLTLNPSYDPRLNQLRNSSQYLHPNSNQHSIVHRISSAPNNTHNLTSNQLSYGLSTSDTRLNVTPPPAPFPSSIWSSNQMSWQQSDDRSKLYFHLSSIFPEEQVKRAMELNPSETNAQHICAAILQLEGKSKV